MAHNLEIVNGKASMFYVGEVPWHGLGNPLDRPATAEEAIESAKMDWKVVKCQNFIDRTGNGDLVKNTGSFAVVREDTGRILARSVGEGYTPLQNKDAFRFFDPIVGEGAAIYHTAGVLGGGERVWIMAKLPDDIRVIGDDIVNKYLLLANGHDGKFMVHLRFTPIRVVCQNTLNFAIGEAGRLVRIPHYVDIQDRMKEAEKILGIVRKQYAGIADTFQSMTRVPMNTKRVSRYMELVFPISEKTDPDEGERIIRQREWATYFFDQGQGNRQKGVQGTLWAAYNGVTEFIDHRRTRQTADQRQKDLWFGEGHLVKTRALETAKTVLSTCLN